jgi:MerR family transcriptional regulator/heat shock protein HspR
MTSEGQNTGPAGSGASRGAVPRRAGARDQAMAVYVISVAAELAGVHPQTLRIYERRGLLGPARTLGGSRRYSDQDIELLRRIGDLTSGGLNLEGVKRVIELEAEVARLRQEVAQARAEARAAVDQVHRYYRRDLVPLDMSPVRWAPQR